MTAGRPVNAQVPLVCSGRRRLAGVSRASVRSFVKPRPDYTCLLLACSNDTPALQPPATTAPVRAVPCWQDTTCCAVLAGHNACVERRRDASTSTNRERSTASRHADACICAWRHHRRHTHSFASLHATGFGPVPSLACLESKFARLVTAASKWQACFPPTCSPCMRSGELAPDPAAL